MKRAGLTLLALLTATAAVAQDLFDIYRLALQNDAAWAIVRADYSARRESKAQGEALLLPTLGLSASRSENNQQIKTSTIDNRFRFNAENYALTLTQPLYRKQNFATYVQGKASAIQAEYALELARQDLMLRVAQAYFDVLAAEDRLAFARAEKNAIAGQQALARRNFEVGTGTLVDVHEAQARYDLVAAEEIAAENDLLTNREALRTLIRIAPEALAKLADSPPLQPPSPTDIEHWVVTAQAQNPQIKAEQQTVEVAHQELEIRRAGHYPTLDLTAARTYNEGLSFLGSPLETTTNQIGLVFQLPLYQGGAVSSQVREAFARRDEAKQRLELTRRQVAQQTRDTYLAVINGMARVQALEHALRSNQKALEFTLLGYERGLRTGIDVLNAQRELYRTKRDLAQVRYAYLLSRLRLKAAAGQLNETDLQDVNRLLSLQ